MSTLGSTKDAFSGESGDSNRAGVGIFFQMEQDGRVYVKTIVSGGSAERDKTIRVGDVIIRVDDRDVTNDPLPLLRRHILGPQGTFVKMTFARAAGDSIEHFDVRLMRGSAEYFAQLDASYRRQGELDILRVQLREALAVGAQDHEELERVKRLLQDERRAAKAREDDFEADESSQTEAILRLQEQLRRAEQMRREVVQQLLPVSEREQDLSEELTRQREKDMLRKEYIEELKKRHDDEKARLAALVSKEQRARRDDQIERMNSEAQLSKAQEELKRLRDMDRLRRDRDAAYQARFGDERTRLGELVMNQEAIRQQIREVEARLGLFYQELFNGAHIHHPPPAPLSNHHQSTPNDLFYA